MRLVVLAFAIVLVGCKWDRDPVTCGKVTDAGAGTWTDAITCLTWQDPLFVELKDWADAVAACDNLELAGYADWRLPTLDELRSLARGCAATVTGGPCAVTDDCLQSSCWSDVCQGCADAELEGPAPGGCYRISSLTGDCMTSWTASVVPDVPDDAWTVGFGGCHVLHYPKVLSQVHVRCVR